MARWSKEVILRVDLALVWSHFEYCVQWLHNTKRTLRSLNASRRVFKVQGLAQGLEDVLRGETEDNWVV